jgi:site-specific DNA-methyltransferase (adenine-specific)
MIHYGDLFDVLPTLAADSIDSCVTDPPYGIGFMGKEWDTFKPGKEAERIVPNKQRESDNPNLRGRTRGPASSPSAVEYNYSADGLRGFQEWTERWAREVFRVLKPGAYMIVCCAPRSYHRMACGLEDAGFVFRDKFAWLFGSGFPKNYNLGGGKGTALKPAHEPIALVWKPFRGTIKACHAQHGTAALNIEACRVGSEIITTLGNAKAGTVAYGDFGGIDPADHAGRWPANVVIDDYAAAAIDAQIAGVSKFYYCAKPSRAERDFGCDDLPERSGGEATDREDGSAGLSNPRAGAGRTGGARNIHPTVKPVALMRWLVRLVTPPGGLVLDPFTGSGTTGMACRYEDRRFVGVEREAEYLAIAERRIAAVAPLFGEDAA